MLGDSRAEATGSGLAIQHQIWYTDPTRTRRLESSSSRGEGRPRLSPLKPGRTLAWDEGSGLHSRITRGCRGLGLQPSQDWGHRSNGNVATRRIVARGAASSSVGVRRIPRRGKVKAVHRHSVLSETLAAAGRGHRRGSADGLPFLVS